MPSYWLSKQLVHIAAEWGKTGAIFSATKQLVSGMKEKNALFMFSEVTSWAGGKEQLLCFSLEGTEAT